MTSKILVTALLLNLANSVNAQQCQRLREDVRNWLFTVSTRNVNQVNQINQFISRIIQNRCQFRGITCRGNDRQNRRECILRVIRRTTNEEQFLQALQEIRYFRTEFNDEFARNDVSTLVGQLTSRIPDITNIHQLTQDLQNANRRILELRNQLRSSDERYTQLLTEYTNVVSNLINTYGRHTLQQINDNQRITLIPIQDINQSTQSIMNAFEYFYAESQRLNTSTENSIEEKERWIVKYSTLTASYRGPQEIWRNVSQQVRILFTTDYIERINNLILNTNNELERAREKYNSYTEDIRKVREIHINNEAKKQIFNKILFYTLIAFLLFVAGYVAYLLTRLGKQ